MDHTRLCKIRRKLVLLAVLMVVANTVSFFEWNKVRNNFNSTDCPESMDFFNKTMDLTLSKVLMKCFDLANVAAGFAILFFCGTSYILDLPQKKIASQNLGAVLMCIGCHCLQIADVARKRKCVEKIIIHFFSPYTCSNQNDINEIASHIIISMICLVASCLIVVLLFIKAFELHVFARDHILELDIPMGVLFGASSSPEPPNQVVRSRRPVTYTRLRDQVTLPIDEPAPEIPDYGDDGLPSYEEALRLREEQNRVGQEPVHDDSVSGHETTIASTEEIQRNPRNPNQHIATQTDGQNEDLSISKGLDFEHVSGDENSLQGSRSDNGDGIRNNGAIRGPSQGNGQ
ncbi:hypothetical protein CAEBREN_20253 [Caenorhabditis brenneri]|uniref:Uncharacterized protein n=1 Tax=Caenorhabditis brenneri TaxID=135651 RepID=G0NKY5_CAEBE|nr:hypothetical protein CAEBREN_20253 [Caenorhabditis brenneri]